MKGQPFDDSEEPFKPDDHLPKPQIGDWVKFHNDEVAKETWGKVVATFDSLAEDWGDDGPTAWTFRDVNTDNGYRGRWYALLTDSTDQDAWACASYEATNVYHKQ